MRRKHQRGYPGCFTRLASRYRSLFTLVWTFLALLSVPAFNGFAHAQSATHRVTFEGKFTASALASGVSVPSGEHFTTLIGAVHNGGATFWSSGAMASAGVEQVAEQGNTATFTSEIKANMNAVAVIEKSLPGGGTPTATVDFTVTTAHPRVTLLTMIAPSPDWFVGVSGLSLLDAQGDWLASHTVDLFPYDAGTEEGTGFSLSNAATSPRGAITSIKGTGKFSNEPIASLTFALQAVAPEITSAATFPVHEGTTAVATLTAEDQDSAAADLAWSKAGGADAGQFTLSSAGALAFAAAPDYENPGDADGDRTYEITVQVSDGDNTDTADIRVTLRNVIELLTQLTGPSSTDYAENGAVRVAAYIASSEADRDGIAWSLGGDDAEHFSIDNPAGVLRFHIGPVDPSPFLQPPDFEAPVDDDDDGVYELIVLAQAGSALTLKSVIVTVTDENEAGAIWLTTARPKMGDPLTATLTDPDGVTAGTVTWQWERSAGRNTWVVIDGAEAASYTPVAADGGNYLRATATYTDGHGAGKSARAVAPYTPLAHQLSALSVTGPARGPYPAFDPKVLHYAMECAVGNPITLTLSAAKSNTRMAVNGVLRPGQKAVVMLTGLDGYSDIPITLTGGQGGATTYVLHCFQEDFPDIATEKGSGATEELIGFSLHLNPPGLDRYGYLVIVDNNGVPRVHRRIGARANHFRPQNSETYPFSYSVPDAQTTDVWVLVDRDLNELDRVTTVLPLISTDRHDFIILDNGDYLLLSYEPVLRDFSSLADGDGNPLPENPDEPDGRYPVLDTAIQIRTPAGAPKLTWYSWDHMAVQDCGPSEPFPSGDWAHGNSLWMSDGVIVASFRPCGKVVAIDAATGDVVWRLGRSYRTPEEWGRDELSGQGRGTGPAPMTILNDPDGEFCGQHSAQVLDNGHVLLYDNGLPCVVDPATGLSQRESGVFSRAVEYAIDPDKGEAIFQRHHSLHGNFNRVGRAAGLVEPMDNGDWLVSWGRGEFDDDPNTALPPDESVTQVDPDNGTEKFSINVQIDHRGEESIPVRAYPLSPVALADEPVALEAETAVSASNSAVHTGPLDKPKVVVAFNQPIVDFTAATPSVSVQGATIDGVSAHTVPGDPANTYLFTLTPAGVGPITFALVAGQSCASGGICTADGTVLTEVGASHVIPPPAHVKSIESDATHPTKDPFTVTITFSEPVTGLTGSEIEVTNGAGSNFSGSGATYRLRVTPDTDFDGDVTVTVPAGAAEDSSMIPNEAGSATFAVDTLAPALAAANGAAVNGATLTLTFDEALGAANVATSAFTVTGATTRSVTGVSVTGTTVRLTSSVPVLHGETGIEVDYDPPSRQPIVDVAGNRAATIADRSVTNDTPATTLSTAVRLTMNEARVAEAGPARTVTVTGMLDRAARPSATTVTIVVGTGTDTATEGTDYATVDDLTLTIPAYATSGTARFTLTPANDRVDEADESLTVRGSTTASGLIVTPSGGLSIGLSDNDPAPSLGLSTDKPSFAEDGGTTTVTVGTGSGSTFETAQTVQLSVAGTATETADYTIGGKTLTLPAGAGTTASMVTATLTGMDDDLDDDGETVVISGTHNGVAFGDRRTVTIEDDDDPEVTVSFAQSGYRAAEGGHVDVAVTLSAVPERQVSIPVEAEGDGADSADFSISPSSLSFGANETTRTVRVSAANDSVVDPGESVALGFGMSLPERVSEGGIAETTVAIRDTDFTFAPAFEAGAGTAESDADTYTVSEASSALRLSLTLETPRGARVVDVADPVVVTLVTRENAGGREADEDYATRRRSGTFGDYGEFDRDLSFAPGDFSDDGTCGCARARKAVSVDLFNDRVYERTEVFGLRLARKSGRLSVSSQDVTAKIAEDDAEPVLTLDANPARIAEAGGASTVTVSTGAGSTFPAAQTIRLELTGTATRGADYTIDSTSLTLPAGMGENPSTVSTTVRALDDPFDDNAETVALSATRDGVEFASRAVAIADDDIGSTRVDLAVNPAQVREDAGETTVRVTATLDGAARAEDTALSVTVGAPGDAAVEGTDYATVPDLTLTIDAGETMAETTFRLAPTNNDSVEGARTITVDGSVPGLAVRSVDLTLNDDDVASTNVTLTLDPREIRESAGSRTVRVTGTLDGGARPTATVVAVTVGTGGDSATEGTDYAEVPELELTIPANRTDGTVTFTLRPTNDRTAEGTETISVRGDVAGLTVTPAELAIADDDTASTRLDLSLNPSTVSEAAVPTEVVVTGSLDAGARTSDSVATVTVGAFTDTATEGLDYANVSTLAITVPANETTGQTTFTLRPDNDAIAEGAETISVTARVSGLTVEPATLTLSDNDTASRVVTLSVDPESVSEDTPADVTVTASLNAGARAENTQVRLTVGAAGDTAVPGTDYEPVSERTLTIPTGKTSGTAVFRLEPFDNDSSDGATTLSVTGLTTVAELRIEPASGARIVLDDDDSPAVLVTPDRLTVVEAASNTYTVELQTRPMADVTVAITGVSGDLSLDRTSLVFTDTDDWSDPQAVTVTAADDADSVRDPDVTLTHRALGAAEYRGLRAELVVTIRENDPSLVFSDSALSVPEGQTATYTVALATLPTADVAVRVTGEFGDLSLDKTQLAFTPGDWGDAQTITVEADEDDDTATDPAVTLAHRASGGGYDGIVGSVRVSVTENDGGGTGGGSGGGGANRPPVVEREIDDRTLDVGEVLELDIRLNFYDRDQRALDYSVESADPSVATVAVDRNGVLTIRGVKRGVTAVTVTAADRRDERASDTFLVAVKGPALVALVPRAADLVREGFVRVINHGDEAGEVSIEAIDDTGAVAGPVVLTLDPHETAHFNSGDLEDGNADKGLPEGIGSGEGDWRLVLDSDLDFEVLSYIRTGDGFLTAMHDVAPVRDGSHRVAVFNPGSNENQVSRLRLVNPGSEAAAVTITGVDDTGASPGTSVELGIPAGASLTLTASDLEAGVGVEGALGDGVGKWRLRVTANEPLVAMSLLSSPTGHLTNLSTVPRTPDDEHGVHVAPLFPSASDPLGRQGFVRVVNRSDESGTVSIEAFDDSDLSYPPVTLALNAKQTRHFNSDDLELGNAEKGLAGSTGTGVGDWRLVLSSEPDIQVLAYIRASDGFLTSMHDVAPSADGQHWVAILNPGSNPNQVSRLRLVNPGDADAEVTISGVDDSGASPGTAVVLTVPAGVSRTLTAAALESGGDGLEGALGDGAGKWRLRLKSETRIVVMSLLTSPTGHLTNLSTARELGGSSEAKGDYIPE